MVFFQALRHDCQELFHLFLECWIQIGTHTTNSVVVERHTGSGCCLKDVEDCLTLTHTVEQRGCGAKVHTVGSEEQQVAGDTRQLVDHHANHLRAAGHLDAESLLDAGADAMLVGKRREVVHTVVEVDGLRICEFFAKLLHSAVDITAIEVDFLHFLSVERRAEAEHAVGCRVLRTDIHDKLLRAEDCSSLFCHIAFSIFHVCNCRVVGLLMIKTDRIDFRILVVVLS